jgi:glycosyltransferase involved in cell wall biosynthesis
MAERFDVLHTHGYKANLYGWLASRGLGIGPVATCHNWPNRKGVLALYATMDRLVLGRFARVFAVSEGVMTLLAQFGIRPPKSQFIANGIDTDRFNGRAGEVRAELGVGGGPVIGTVTRLVPGKGIEVVLDAFPAVLVAHPGARLLVVGAGPLDSALKEQAGRLGLEDRVIFTGARGDMPEVYSALDVFVLASFDEGMPMTVLEAMSSGRGVVATRVGAIPRLIRDGENGRLIEPRDAGAVSAAILDVLGKPGLGEAARRTIVQDFSALAMAGEYRKHYAELGRLKTVAV